MAPINKTLVNKVIKTVFNNVCVIIQAINTHPYESVQYNTLAHSKLVAVVHAS